MAETKHTAEPWVNGTAKLLNEGKEIYLDYGHYKAHLCNISTIAEKDDEIAAHIVSCVNACAGFSEAELETLGHFKAMHEIIVAENEELKLRTFDVMTERCNKYHDDEIRLRAERNALCKQISEMESYISTYISNLGLLTDEQQRDFWREWNRIIGVSTNQNQPTSSRTREGDGC